MSVDGLRKRFHILLVLWKAESHSDGTPTLLRRSSEKQRGQPFDENVKECDVAILMYIEHQFKPSGLYFANQKSYGQVILCVREIIFYRKSVHQYPSYSNYGEIEAYLETMGLQAERDLLKIMPSFYDAAWNIKYSPARQRWIPEAVFWGYQLANAVPSCCVPLASWLSPIPRSALDIYWPDILQIAQYGPSIKLLLHPFPDLIMRNLSTTVFRTIAARPQPGLGLQA